MCLKSITEQELKGNLTLHIVEASNVNLIYVLHGYRLCPTDKIFEYQIIHRRKSEKKTIAEIRPCEYKNPPFDNHMPRCCLSTFFYKKTDGENCVICESYLSFSESNEIYKVDEVFDPEANEPCWSSGGEIQPYIFVLNLDNPVPINMDRIKFVDFCRKK